MSNIIFFVKFKADLIIIVSFFMSTGTQYYI